MPYQVSLCQPGRPSADVVDQGEITPVHHADEARRLLGDEARLKERRSRLTGAWRRSRGACFFSVAKALETKH
jgi:hypothetical protein